ncbi:DNA sulfur modification protein DndC [Paraburkholderia unamae]|uniref:DNA phosphorothioation system sulfurtransferase DndC n=1 Tax=Paraburkholderia unamae TaxID=219649 RepID=UPI000DC4575C|nr:DNA phosphorothioation system sulfurtransferase DndC [Paraburkholderia unamae]RAR66995.1 DNA sulfur modification protein DndC [Paraburkholderia unamae]
MGTVEPLYAEPNVDSLWREILHEVREEYLSESQHYPWIVGFSGGKDSTLVAHAVFEALLSIPPSARTRPVHIVSNDTQVESPFVVAHLNEVTEQIRRAAENLDLPIDVARTQPDLDKTFWTLLIGKGYPSPNSNMRWCTDRLKIAPTSSYIRKYVSECGAAIVVLGVRSAESNKRQQTIQRYQNLRNSRLNEHNDLSGALVYRPIVHLTTDDVWELLGSMDAPWGGTHGALFKLYRDAEGGECPVVLSKEEAPGCGTANSRFGCWTCTVVEKDRSLQGYIDAGNHQYRPLVDFRDWLKSIRNDPMRRQAMRRNGRLTFDATGRHIPGPFTIQARREILDRLLATQAEFDSPLISQAELDLIHEIWAKELQQDTGVGDGN